MTGGEARLPHSWLPYKRTSVFDQDTMPAGLRRQHSTREDVWAVIRVIEGRLHYRLLADGAESILDPEHPGVVRPAELHEVTPLGTVRFFIEFYRRAATTAPATAAADTPHG